jgi:tRNA(Ile)-lysidine synthase
VPRSHPPTLITLCRRTLVEECRLEPGAHVLAAVSGGPDSLAMLDALARHSQKLSFELTAHGIDHGLRAEASAELDLAEAHAKKLGVAFGRTRLGMKPGSNLMARARTERYRALEAAQRAAGATLLATAHQADDRAETVLMRLLRGSGPRGLAVLPARAGSRIRPLLRARKSDIFLHLTRHAIRFAEDPTNRDRRHLRTRVRLELVPVLEELSPGIVRHLNALADALARDETDETIAAWAAPFALGRAQRDLLRRAIERRQLGARVRLRGGLELGFDASSEGLRLVAGRPLEPARPTRNSRPRARVGPTRDP